MLEQLFHGIKQRGYTGSFSNLERLLAKLEPRRKVRDIGRPPIIRHQPAGDAVPIRAPATGHIISPVVAAALFMKPRGMLTISSERAAVGEGPAYHGRITKQVS
ncbi:MULTISPECIES: hypothetical protein [Mesorhizobium]|uniref:hypothetical protein n=1 Tax=Mesorhizobium TaxID=68287 RepID=UPI0007ECC1C5|nr:MULTISPECIES: hypothetical protein [Mesorhizobium]PBB52472.1 hypothetical protein CK223_28845 [Mesorhizobium loti]QIA25461.1 hypothetical protein A9K68_029890 [Mesorhizobium sp. AA22]